MLIAESQTDTVQGGLVMLDHLVIGIYLAAMLAMGFTIARRQKSTEDFFVGGRNLPAWAVGISLIASLLSTITYLGMPGEMFRTGIGFLTRQLGIPLVLLVVWFLWIPFFMKLRLTSVYEYLEKRFNYSTRVLAAVFCLLLLFGWISVVVLTASMAMAEITQLDVNWFFGQNTEKFRDADMHLIILSVGLFSVLYTTMGGIRAVVWTDVIQFFVLIAGALFTMGFIAWKTNSGIGDWIDAQLSYPHRETVEWFSWDVANRSTVFSIAIGMFFWHICTHGANQVALQRYFTVRDEWSARKSFLVNALSSVGLGIILAGVGIALIYFINREEFTLPAEARVMAEVNEDRHDAQDKIFPQFIHSGYFPAGLRGLVVAALFAAAMSTIDSGANSISTIVTVDFFRRLSRKESKAERELKLARVLTGCIGVIVVAATIFLYHISKGRTNLVDLCQRGFNCFLGPLGALFVLAMFSRKATAKTVFPAVLIGEVVGIGTSYCKDLTAWLANDYGGWFARYLGGKPIEVEGNLEYAGIPFSTHLVIASSWLTTIVASHLFALLLRSETTPEQRQLMWKPVVQGDKLHSSASDG